MSLHWLSTLTSLVELTTPAVLVLVDTNPQSATSLSDQDLDAEDLGGTLPWALPRDHRLVTHYQVYLLRVCLDESIVRRECNQGHENH